MRSSLATPWRQTGGFSLLEVLVASAVLAIVLSIMLGAMATTIGLWRNTDNAVAADREGRSANQLLYDDLSSAVVPRSQPKFWPRVESNGTYLAFLTRKPIEYQDQAAGDVGEVCFVEYVVEDNALKRRFTGSRLTHESMRQGKLPAASGSSFQVLATNIIPAATAMRRTVVARTAADLQAITPNFVPVSRGWVERTNTVTFNNRPDLSVGTEFQDKNDWYRVFDTTNIMTTNPATGIVTMRVDAFARPLYWQPTFIVTPRGDRPQAIEVNLPATDLTTMGNRDLLEDPNFLVRNPGFYHFRATLFPSP
jgi:prepilin-type N-terminal cleavage/methylation domain-containing protein